MSRESIRDEPVLDLEIVEQNEELMDEKFPDELLEDWNAVTVPTIKEIISGFKGMSDEDLRLKSHKCAGSALQLGGHQLGTALRTASHMIQAGSRSQAEEILEDVQGYYDAFDKAIQDSKK
ncbi:hypothetical protein TRFO_04321 [Tritrichomonas foetus]|uniref:HPt domain-containing protein n=1 Tax=Tritrichomonas foetus TaxID=1144522 RepID=A0A1J4KLN2_9EUKA|nr:hypothetical protein TRFO_04321 [Tritrichomonas foetus]|eukprot:OHT10285.1 hypothetical protein TRFO_04321 [Tritrichomonas foetus]